MANKACLTLICYCLLIAQNRSSWGVAADGFGGKKEEHKVGEGRSSGYGFPANIQISPPTTHALGGSEHTNTSPFLQVRLGLKRRGPVRGSDPCCDGIHTSPASN